MNTPNEIHDILASQTFAVVGVSRSPEKYGRLVWNMLRQAGKTAYAVNASATLIDGQQAFADLDSLPEHPEAAVMVVPPTATEQSVRDCIRLGIKRIWMQPGAESPEAIRLCEDAGIETVAGGPCIMVLLRTQGILPKTKS